ncbi:MAG TPA: pyridoxamine 5'-phosphate oxidase family protein [Trebonia sp.]|nr:pyridoxamine 5'-phosphate oxidase family protein [Trebonia sp.]
MMSPEPATGGDSLPTSERTTVHRYGEMQSWRREDLYAVLDEGLVAHVGFTAKHGPVVIPMAFARDREYLYMHGSTGSGLGMAGGAGVDLAVTVSIVDGLVYASSLFDSTFNYRCAMVFGTAVPVSEQERYEAVRLISERLMPGRWQEVREPTSKELAATKVLKLPLDTCSVKIFAGPPDTDVVDGLWTGELPIVTRVLAPVPQPGVDAPVPPSVERATASLGGAARPTPMRNESEMPQ